MGLAEALIAVPQTERGGEIAQQGFDYQSCWALSEMLEYELKGKDYVFIFEYHDDVLILDSEDDPQELIFAQVKTRDKHWTAYNLYSTTQNKPLSVIGKLYHHHKTFSKYSPKLMFVTNAVFSFHPKTGSKTHFKATSINQEIQDKFVEMILQQVEIQNVDLSILSFIQSSLSLEDHMVHLIGKICEFLSKKYGTEYTLNAKQLSLVLESKCREKSKFNSNKISSFTNLVAKKGLSSKALNNIIEDINESSKIKPTWNSAKDIFISLGKNTIQTIQLESAFSIVGINLNLNDTNPYSMYLQQADLLYDKSKVEYDLNCFLSQTINAIDNLYPDYALALTDEKKECIIVYSVIQNLLREGEK